MFVSLCPFPLVLLLSAAEDSLAVIFALPVQVFLYIGVISHAFSSG